MQILQAVISIISNYQNAEPTALPVMWLEPVWLMDASNPEALASAFLLPIMNQSWDARKTGALKSASAPDKP